jgi:hypothetical protein
MVMRCQCSVLIWFKRQCVKCTGAADEVAWRVPYQALLLPPLGLPWQLL